MTTDPVLTLGALENALMWVSDDAGFLVSACMSRDTGAVFLSGFDGEGGVTEAGSRSPVRMECDRWTYGY